LDLGLSTAGAATVTGHLSDISIQDLNTKMMFAPTNEVLLVGSGLSAGPPRIIDTANGAFSVALDAGDYTVSLPLVTWRHPFCISVPQSAFQLQYHEPALQRDHLHLYNVAAKKD
jgi:hypothetical protein